VPKTVIVAVVIASIIAASLVSFPIFAQSYNIPLWIKNNAKWWSEGKIGDSDFIGGIKYLIENKIMIIEQKQFAEPENIFDAPLADSIDLPNGLEVEYNVLFVTSDDNCTWEEFGKMHFYNEVTYYYLLSWGLEPTYIDPLCIPDTNYEDLPEEYFGKDLTILMVDEVITEQHLVEYQHAWGYFQPPNLIVSGELTDIMTEVGLLTEEDIASEWVLTHELAHFVTYYVGEPESVVGDWVHNMEDWNKHCILQDPNDPMCSEIYAEIEVNGMRVIVMNPYAYYYYEN